MPSQIRLYRLKDFIRASETGVLDVKRSEELIRQLAAASGFHAVENMLVDLRNTTIEGERTADLLDIAAEFTRYEAGFRGKIANVIPGDAHRISVTKQIRDVIGFHRPDMKSLRPLKMQLTGYQK
jgi:hypothetical protein